MIGKELDKLRPCPICNKPARVITQSVRSAGGLKTPMSKLLSITIGCVEKGKGISHNVTVKANTVEKAVRLWEHGQG